MNNQSLTIDQIPEPSEMKRLPLRPLGTVSDFVALELPNFIRDVKKGNRQVDELSNTVEELCEHTNIRQRPTTLGHLDLFMLRTSIASLKGKVGEKIQTLCEQYSMAIGSLGVLTYEDLIHANPLETDPRVLTNRSELFFYGAHRKIETACSEIVCLIEELLSKQNDSEIIADGVRESVCPRLQLIQKQMEQMNTDLSVDDFTRMRPFFMAYGQEKMRGPSGNFSAGIFSVDSLIYGQNVEMQAFQLMKLCDLKYYPMTTAHHDSFSGRNDMITSHAHGLKGHTVHAILANGSDESRSVLRTTLTAMSNIRKVHFGLARKFIVEPLVAEGQLEESEIEGTARHKLKSYLMKARTIYDDAISSLT